MTTPHFPLSTMFSGWSKQVVKAFGLLSLLWVAWLGWQASEQWFERPLPADRVSAKQIRVNETQRQKLVKDLESYHSPAPNETLGTITFQGTTTTR